EPAGNRQTLRDRTCPADAAPPPPPTARAAVAKRETVRPTRAHLWIVPSSFTLMTRLRKPAGRRNTIGKTEYRLRSKRGKRSRQRPQAARSALGSAGG